MGENCWNVRPQALQSRMVNAWYPGTCKQIKEKIMHMRNEVKMVDMAFDCSLIKRGQPITHKSYV